MFILISCVYGVSLTGYIFPYSYAMVYALNSFIWALVALLYFLEQNKIKFLYLSFFLYGLCISFKYEFILFIIVLLSAAVIKKTTLNQKLQSVLFMFAAPVFSLALLFIQGAKVENLKEALYYMLKLAGSKSALNLYSFLGFIPSLESFKSMIINFGLVSVCIIYYVMIYLFFEKHKNKRGTGIIFAISAFAPVYALIPMFIKSNSSCFNYIGIVSIILFAIFSAELIKKKKENKLDLQDEMFFVLFASVLLVSLKCIFNISFNSYGTYYFPLLLLCTAIYMLKYTSALKKYPKIFIIILLFFSAVYYFSNMERAKYVHNAPVNFDKGYIKLPRETAEPVWEVYKYIMTKTKKEDTVLVLPEGAMFNFLTGRKSHDKYYYLIPPNLEIFGERKIAADLENNLPGYLVIQPMSYINFKETYFCESFGGEICALIPKYYEKPIIFGNDFCIGIYKKKT